MNETFLNVYEEFAELNSLRIKFVKNDIELKVDVNQKKWVDLF